MQFLHATGARKIVVANVPPLGCVPLVRFLSLSPPGSCNDAINAIVSQYNTAFIEAMDQLRESLPNTALLTFDAYSAFFDISSRLGKIPLLPITHLVLNTPKCANGSLLVYLRIPFLHR